MRELGADFGVSAAHAGITITATTLGVALAAPVVGLVADIAGRKRLIVCGALALAAAAWLAALADSLPALLWLRFVQGVAIAAVFAATLAYIGEECRGSAVSELTAIFIAGTVLGGFCSRFLTGLATAAWGWRPAFIGLGASSLMIAAAVSALLPPSSERRRATTWAGALESLRQQVETPGLLAAFGIGFGILFAQVATFTYVGLHLAEPPFGLNTAQIGSIYAVFLVAMVATPLAGQWIGRIGHRRCLLAALVCGAVGMLLTLVPTLPIILLGLTLSSSATFACQATASSYVSAATRGGGSASGLYLTFYYAGGSLGAVIPGAAWSVAGWSGCVALVIAIQALTGLIGLLWPLSVRPLPVSRTIPGGVERRQRNAL